MRQGGEETFKSTSRAGELVVVLAIILLVFLPLAVWPRGQNPKPVWALREGLV